ncbi:thiolase family protein [Spongiibacter sp. KMU-166]|uniref:Thiolase family protein n=1 Tax=Spongiibacter thalassae TaxID=2721624 RepID=A0ABX1GHD6_9GAMM|nr:thiolase family protein [Spongiibacter thalassae]NKI18629.1 thiolase family protein [Spongiibacter thalassae]
MSGVAIVGVGLSPFGRSSMSGLQQGAVAVRAALEDAGLQWTDIQCAYGGSQDAGNADALANLLGHTGIHFTNIWNGCATGGSAISAAANAIRAGEADIALAVGFDKHPRGAFAAKPSDWGIGDWYGESGLMLTTQFFGMKINRYLHDHALDPSILAQVSRKAYANGAITPHAWRQQTFTEADINQSDMLSYPLRKLMFCSPAEGGAAIILCRSSLAKDFHSTPITLRASVVRGREFGSFEVFSPSLPTARGRSATEIASVAAFEQAGVGPGDIDVAQLQDTEAGAEIIHLAENGFCEHGEQGEWLKQGHTEIGGKLPVNTDGGCIANGEPVGASGLRQVIEVCWQLRGQGGRRQVPCQPRLGYTQVYGAPGISGVNILERAR